jgi:hypothetical protein
MTDGRIRSENPVTGFHHGRRKPTGRPATAGTACHADDQEATCSPAGVKMLPNELNGATSVR